MLQKITRDNLKEALGYMYDAEKLAVSRKNDTMLYKIYERKYYLELGANRVNEAFKQAQGMIEIAEKLQDKEKQAHCYYLIGNIYSSLDQLDKAAENEKTAVEYYKAANNPGEVAWHTYLVGYYLYNNGDYEDALQYFQTAYDLSLKAGKSSNFLSEVTGWIGNSYSELHNYISAFEWRYRSKEYAEE